MFVEHVTVDEFKKKLDTIYRSTGLPSQFYSVHDNIRDIIQKDLIREDANKDAWKDHQTHVRSFSVPEEHDKYPEEVHAYAAKQFQIVSTKMNLHLLKH